MPGFRNIREVVDAELDGAQVFSTFRKTALPIIGTGSWADMNVMPGMPLSFAYSGTPLAAIAMSQSLGGSIYHGGNVSPLKKYLRRVMVIGNAVASLPAFANLCDYLLYYPHISESVLGEQTLTNGVSISRHVSGVGVRMMAVSIFSSGTFANPPVTFTVRYTNSDGVANRVSKIATISAVAGAGVLITSSTIGSFGNNSWHFIALQDGDVGVRSVQGVTMITPDIGTFALVLVKPVVNLVVRGVDAPVEIDFLRDFSIAPEIVDDACLNLIATFVGSAANASLIGTLEFTWK